MKHLAIDPGCEFSAYVLWDGSTVLEKGKLPNNELLKIVTDSRADHLAVEMVASYGMPVGKEVFETVRWIGKFEQAWLLREYRPTAFDLIYRKEIKIHHCRSMKAKDSNIRQALIDKYGAPGTKKAPGKTYGISSDVWSAFAIATYITEKQVA